MNRMRRDLMPTSAMSLSAIISGHCRGLHDGMVTELSINIHITAGLQESGLEKLVLDILELSRLQATGRSLTKSPHVPMASSPIIDRYMMLCGDLRLILTYPGETGKYPTFILMRKNSLP